MKHILVGAISAVAFFAAAGAALSADPIMDPPAVIATDVFDWTGFYVGAQVGGIASQNVILDDIFNFSPASPGGGVNRYRLEPSITGWLGGVHIGANKQMGQFVLGLVGDVNWVGASGNDVFSFYDNTVAPPNVGNNNNEPGSISLRWNGSARVNVGVALGRIMPFLTAGVSVAQADHTTRRNYGVQGGGIHNFNGSANLVGGTIGAGVSFAATEHLIITGDYRFTHYGAASTIGRDATTNTGNYQLSMDTHQATISASFLF